MYKLAVLSKIKSHSDATDYFKELPFKTPSKNHEQILTLYEQINVIKTDQAFTGYAMPYKVEIIEKKDLIV